MTVAMALAESTHHSSRGQRTARAGCGARVELHGHDPGPFSPTHTHQPELFSLHEEEPGGTQPDRIPSLSGPQERDLRRTVQQIVDTVPLVPLLDDLAPQMVGQLLNSRAFP